MAKEDILKEHMYSNYQDLDKIMTDDKYTEEDLKCYLRFCDNQTAINRPLNANIYGWTLYNTLIKKLRTKGVESVLMRSDVSGVSKKTEKDERGGVYTYLVLETNYGPITI